MLSVLLLYCGVLVVVAFNDTINSPKNETMDIALPLTRCNATLLDELCGFAQVVVCVILCIVMCIVKRDRLTNTSPYASTPNIEI
jgi:hypothetical protein